MASVHGASRLARQVGVPLRPLLLGFVCVGDPDYKGASMTTPATTTPTRVLQIEFLFLDLDTCTRCRATDATLLEAIERTRPALNAAGVAVSVTKTLVVSEAQAQALGFVSSPTIRINGVDIAGELVESACDSCSETCACNGGVDCRDWLWQGERSHEPPLGLIVEAIMRHAGGADPHSPPASPPSSATVPANLRQYFAATGTASGCCGHGVADAACGCQA
ncbi:MAG TPA: DUF2703 domain-containing protein [Actinomycetota bacterium]|jgi:hypothetical protein|nr:DUF2703 domain-containing protein [Actinomycetota bacterium]